MTYSYSQLSQYLTCPRKYRYRYLDGWVEKDSRANMLFGRAFEKALAALLTHDDAGSVLFQEWARWKSERLVFGAYDNWDKMLQQGIELLERFASDERVVVKDPARNLQVKFFKQIDCQRDFVGYIDAVGELDGTRCLIDWKTTSACLPTEPQGLTGLDPQLVCYSWLTGISPLAFVVFVRKKLPEIQYLKAEITDRQRVDFERLLFSTVERIEAAHFPQHSGIRFPQNACVACPYLGLCLDLPHFTEQKLSRGGADLAWIDELVS
jgi:PD-(D/E)XK nuclease superfamily